MPLYFINGLFLGRGKRQAVTSDDLFCEETLNGTMCFPGNEDLSKENQNKDQIQNKNKLKTEKRVNSARDKRQIDNVAEHLKPHREPRLNRAKRHVRISGTVILFYYKLRPLNRLKLFN